MFKWLIRILLILFFSVLLSILGVSFSENYFSLIFTVMGIMFSAAISLILSFSFSDVKNDEYVKRYRSELYILMRNFIVALIITGLLIILPKAIGEHTLKIKKFSLSLNAFWGVLDMGSVLYVIYNFSKLFKVKSEMEDEIRKSD